MGSICSIGVTGEQATCKEQVDCWVLYKYAHLCLLGPHRCSTVIYLLWNCFIFKGLNFVLESLHRKLQRSACNEKRKCPAYFFLAFCKLTPAFPIHSPIYILTLRFWALGKKKIWWYYYTTDNSADTGKKYQRRVHWSISMKGSCGNNENNLQRKWLFPKTCEPGNKNKASELLNSYTFYNWNQLLSEDWRNADYDTQLSQKCDR